MTNANTNQHRGLTTSWLVARLGLQPSQIERLRRSSRLLGLNDGAGAHVYPAWQFGPDGRPLEVVPRLLGAARDRGLTNERLVELLTRRSGLTSGQRLLDEVLAGRPDRTFRVIAGVG